MAVPFEPFFMIQNNCPSEISFIVCLHVKFLGLGFMLIAIDPLPLPAMPWQCLQASGFALIWARTLPFLMWRGPLRSGFIFFRYLRGAFAVFRSCGQTSCSGFFSAHEILAKPLRQIIEVSKNTAKIFFIDLPF